MRRPWNRRLRELDEAEAYARCHGDRAQEVRVVKLEPRRPRYRRILQSGEKLRKSFEERLNSREPYSA